MKTLIINDRPFELVLMLHALTQRGVEVIGSATTVNQAMLLFEQHKPKVILIDVRFNHQAGVDLCHELREINPLLGLIIISDCPDFRILGLSPDQIPLGSQIILKTIPNVVELIYQSVALSVLAAKAKQRFTWAGQDDPLHTPLFTSILSGLTDIQIETLRLLGNGFSNSEISRIRFVSEKSVEQIITKISTYFGVGSDPTKNQRVLLAEQYFRWIGTLKR